MDELSRAIRERDACRAYTGPDKYDALWGELDWETELYLMRSERLEQYQNPVEILRDILERSGHVVDHQSFDRHSAHVSGLVNTVSDPRQCRDDQEIQELGSAVEEVEEDERT